MGPKLLRLSHQRLQVLGPFLRSREEELSGADVMRLTGMASGSLYPILYVLEENGLLESRWETEDPSALGRPRRRLYKATALGESAARAAVADFAGLISPIPARGEQ